VSWGAPAQQEIKVRGYVLGWGKGIPDEEQHQLDENNRFYEIVGLEPNSEYVISLRARNAMGDGQPVYDTVRTREETPVEVPAPLEVPVGLRAIPMSGTTIVVYWTDTTLSKSQHVSDNRHYMVRFSSTGSTRFRYHNTTDLNCMIGDLRPNTQYEFAVKVVKGRRESSWSMSVLNTTHHLTPGSPPRDLTVRMDDRNPQNAILTWQTPKQTPGINGYVVFYTIDTSKRDRDWSVEGVVGDTNTAVIRNLKPMTTYYFKVQSRNAKGQNGPFSAMIVHTTGAGKLNLNSFLRKKFSIHFPIIRRLGRPRKCGY
jgi:neogenin